MKNLHCIMAQNQYGAYCVPAESQHRPAAQRILNSEVYEPKTLQLIRHYAGKGDIIHAGAYFGDFLPALSKSTRGQVYAFEPHGINWLCAHYTTLLNECSNVALLQAALGETTDSALLKTHNEAGVALGGGCYVSATGNERVAVRALDEYIPAERTISVLHLDVEGSELSALRGAIGILQRCQPVVIIENGSEAVDIFLAEQGYKKEQVIEGNTLWIA